MATDETLGRGADTGLRRLALAALAVTLLALAGLTILLLGN